MKTKWSINSGIVADYYGEGNEVRSVRHDHELGNIPRSNQWARANHCPPLLTVAMTTITVAVRREAWCPRSNSPAGSDGPGERRNHASKDNLLVGIRPPPW